MQAIDELSIVRRRLDFFEVTVTPMTKDGQVPDLTGVEVQDLGKEPIENIKKALQEMSQIYDPRLTEREVVQLYCQTMDKIKDNLAGVFYTNTVGEQEYVFYKVQNRVRLKWHPKKPFVVKRIDRGIVKLSYPANEDKSIILTNMRGHLFLQYQKNMFYCGYGKNAIPNIPFLRKLLNLAVTDRYSYKLL